MPGVCSRRLIGKGKSRRVVEWSEAACLLADQDTGSSRYLSGFNANNDLFVLSIVLFSAETRVLLAPLGHRLTSRSTRNKNILCR